MSPSDKITEITDAPADKPVVKKEKKKYELLPPFPDDPDRFIKDIPEDDKVMTIYGGGHIKRYNVAHYLRRLREFPHWNEDEYDGDEELEDDQVVYLNDKFTVTVGIVVEPTTLIWHEHQVTDHWKRFCWEVLGFDHKVLSKERKDAALAEWEAKKKANADKDKDK